MNKNKKETAQEVQVQEQFNFKIVKTELTIKTNEIRCKVRS